MAAEWLAAQPVGTWVMGVAPRKRLRNPGNQCRGCTHLSLNWDCRRRRSHPSPSQAFRRTRYCKGIRVVELGGNLLVMRVMEEIRSEATAAAARVEASVVEVTAAAVLVAVETA